MQTTYAHREVCCQTGAQSNKISIRSRSKSALLFSSGDAATVGERCKEKLIAPGHRGIWETIKAFDVARLINEVDRRDKPENSRQKIRHGPIAGPCVGRLCNGAIYREFRVCEGARFKEERARAREGDGRK